MNASQQEKVLARLMEGKSITPLEALRDFGCFRLGARIFNLRKQGYNIVSRTVVASDGKKFSEYSLIGMTRQNARDVGYPVAGDAS